MKNTNKMMSLPVLFIAICSTQWPVYWAIPYALGFYFIFWLILSMAMFGYYFVRFHITKNSYAHIPLAKNPSVLSLFGLFNRGGVEKIINDFQNEDGSFPPCFYHGVYTDGSHVVSLCDADAIKQVLTKVDAFPKFPPVYDTLATWIGDGLVTAKGAIWKKQRSLLTEMFHFKRLKSYLPTMHCCTSEFMQTLLQRPECKDEKPGILLHAHQEFKDLTLGVIVECAFGGDIDRSKVTALFDEWNKSIEVAFAVYMFYGNTVAPYLPIPWSLLGMRSMLSIKEEIDRIALDAIRRKRASWSKQSSEQSGQSDLVSEMFRAEEQSGQKISDAQIQAEVFTFLLAGTETSSNCLAFTMQCIAEHPEVQARIQAEVDALPEFKSQDASVFTSELIKKLPYTRATLEETLRRYPIVPYLERQVKQATTLAGTHIPAGTTVLLWFYAASNDEKQWSAAAEFKPDRFMQETKERRHAFAYTPFSAGKRNCIGRNFALQELSLVVAMMLHKYDVTLVQKGIMSFETTVICDGGVVRLTERERS